MKRIFAGRTILAVALMALALRTGTVEAASQNDAATVQIPQSVCTYRYSRQSVSIHGHSITVEYYVPKGTGPFPLAFMLHSSAGAYSLKSPGEPLRDNFGEKTLASSCFAVVLPHYLEAFGVKSMTSTSEIASLSPQILAVSNTLLTDAESLPWTKGQPVFLFGESLGGYLSVSLGLRRNEVRAVSEISGGLPAEYAIANPHQVAILISHGVDDTLVPVRNADDLKQYCLHHHLATSPGRSSKAAGPPSFTCF